MKKLIGLLVIMFVTTSVFGQKFIRSPSFIETTLTENSTIEDAIHKWNITDGNYDWVAYVHFVQNDRLFLLSYEPKEDRMSGGYRDIYLYSKDINDINSPWEKASDVVMTNHWGSDKDHNEVDFYVYDENKHNSSIGKVVVEDDCVKITIGWELFINGRQMINEPITFTFVPVGDNVYARR